LTIIAIWVLLARNAWERQSLFRQPKMANEFSFS